MNYLKYRRIRLVAWLVRFVGFVLLYLALERVDSLFAGGGITLGYSPDKMGWIQAHYGGIAILLILASYVLEFIEHVWEAADLNR